MKKILLLSLLFISLGCWAQPTLSPSGGIYSGTQHVLITPPAGAGQTCFYTTDGSTPSIAGLLAPTPPATLPISTNTTLTVVCAKVGVMSRASNTDPNTGPGFWQCDVLNSCGTSSSSCTFPSGVTCKVGGGITGQPTNVFWTPGNSPMTERMVTGSGTGSVQMLFTHPTDTTACPDCNWLVQDKIVQVNTDKTKLENNEMDLNINMHSSSQQFHSASLQCNQQATNGRWQIGPQCNGTTTCTGAWGCCGWTNAPGPASTSGQIQYGCQLSTTQQTEIRYGIHWINGDTSCTWTKAGVTNHVSCDVYDSITICVGGSLGTGGTCKDFKFSDYTVGNVPVTFPGDPDKGANWGTKMIQQDQPDGTSGGNPLDTTRSVWNNNATLAYWGTSSGISAQYVINAVSPTPPLTLGSGSNTVWGGKITLH